MQRMKIGKLTVNVEQVQCENIEISVQEIPELNKLIDAIKDSQISIIEANNAAMKGGKTPHES